LNAPFKVFHFQELDWLVYFPIEGNRGKYCGYSVIFKDRKKKKTDVNNCAILGALLEQPELDEHYPHTVGFFKSQSTNNTQTNPCYMEIRVIHNVDKFWLFLNSLNL
jgi:hypothetical protein